MLTLSRLYLRADRRIEGSLEEFVNPLFKSADSASRGFFRRIKKTGVVVQVREGSVEIIIIITTVAGVLYKGISDYPTFRKGLDELLKDARKVGRWIRSKIVENPKLEEKEIQRSQVTRGHLMQLDRIIRLVEEGEISPNDAREMALRLFERVGGEVSEDLRKRLLTFFKNVPKQPKAARAPRRAGPSVEFSPRMRRVYRRGVMLERKPGEKEVLQSDLY